MNDWLEHELSPELLAIIADTKAEIRAAFSDTKVYPARYRRRIQQAKGETK